MSSCHTVSTAWLLLVIRIAMQCYVARGSKATFLVMALAAATFVGSQWKDTWSIFA